MLYIRGCEEITSSTHFCNIRCAKKYRVSVDYVSIIKVKINLTVTRTKKKDIIEEIFSITTPSNKYKLIGSQGRVIFFAVWKLRLMLMLKDYKLLKTVAENNIIINHYEYKPSTKMPQLFQKLVLNYKPVMSKKCSYCIFSENKNRKNFCKIRGKKLKYDTWRNCLYWREIPKQ